MTMKISQVVVNDVTDRYVNNLLRLASVANGEGLDGFWYVYQRYALLSIANDYGVSLDAATYVTATLSPALSWEKNLESTRAFFDEWFGRHGNSRQTAYGANVKKCSEYMFGLRQGTPTGRKVSCFYHNLMGDKQALTLDRHAIRAARWGVRNMGGESGEQKICDAEFAVVESAYRKAAKLLGVSPSYLQALVWQLFCQ
jgi:hypothetical protein